MVMNNLHMHYLDEISRRPDELKAVEAYRLAKKAEITSPATLKFHQRFLTVLGLKMVQWGYRLQARYDELITAPGQIKSVNH
jgi:hypothetical protein